MSIFRGAFLRVCRVFFGLGWPRIEGKKMSVWLNFVLHKR